MAESNAHHGGMLVPEPTQMETVSGRFVDTLNPDPATIDPADIAHHLSVMCRYGGGVSRFYSVAEHAVLVHDLIVHMGESQVGVRLGALLHDAAEAYLQDLISPAKFSLRCEELAVARDMWGAEALITAYEGAYQRLSSRMDQAVAFRFRIPATVFDFHQIKLADMWALRIEAAALTHSGGANWRWPGELPEDGQLPTEVRWVGGLLPEEAAAAFADRLSGLGIDLGSGLEEAA